MFTTTDNTLPNTFQNGEPCPGCGAIYKPPSHSRRTRFRKDSHNTTTTLCPHWSHRIPIPNNSIEDCILCHIKAKPFPSGPKFLRDTIPTCLPQSMSSIHTLPEANLFTVNLSRVLLPLSFETDVADAKIEMCIQQAVRMQPRVVRHPACRHGVEIFDRFVRAREVMGLMGVAVGMVKERVGLGECRGVLEDGKVDDGLFVRWRVEVGRVLGWKI